MNKLEEVFINAEYADITAKFKIEVAKLEKAHRKYPGFCTCNCKQRNFNGYNYVFGVQLRNVFSMKIVL
jgi:hypothetical protein